VIWLPPLERLARRVQEIYLHIDFDGFAPEVAPGIVDEPVPGGLSFEDAEGIMRAAAERFRIRAATLATYTPELDKEERTLRVGLLIIELLGGLTQQSRWLSAANRTSAIVRAAARERVEGMKLR